jgi:predicted transcriptional regulator
MAALASICLKIQVKEDAEHVGGINLFGEKYGDYPQGIVMNLTYL